MTDEYDVDCYDAKGCPGDCDECEFDPEKYPEKRASELDDEDPEWDLARMDSNRLKRLFVLDGEVEAMTRRDLAVLAYQNELCKNFLVMVLNKLLLIHPLVYTEFNRIMTMETDLQRETLLDLEATFPAVGITEISGKVAFTTLSLIATITEILCGDRLAFLLDQRIAEGGKMYACEWYYKDSVPRQNFLNWICGYPEKARENG